MAQDAPKRRFLSLIFLVSCISKSFLMRVIVIVVVVVVVVVIIIILLSLTQG